MCTFSIYNYDYNKKERNLNIKSQGKVESTKYFPIFIIDGKEYIFKPLSKTKPLLTPLFAYSEVYWSYLINKYIDSKTPRYRLAYCNELTNNQEKYYDKGTIVPNILEKDEKLINLLEFYRKYPDSLVNIDEYINYCEVQYNYENILKSTFFEERKDLRKKLCMQILCSILRRDANYHYENVSLIEKNGKIVDVAPMIDMEFSEMFLYPDNNEKHETRFSEYDEGICPIFKYDETKPYEENYDLFKQKIEDGSIYDNIDRYRFYNLLKNLKTIVELHPEVVRDFLTKLEKIRKEVNNLTIEFNDNYLETFSSKDYILGKLRIKDNVSVESDEYVKTKRVIEKDKIKLNKEEFNNKLRKEVLWNIDKMTYILNLLLDYYDGKYIPLNKYSNETLYKPIERISEKILYMIFNKDNKKYIKSDKGL